MIRTLNISLGQASALSPPNPVGVPTPPSGEAYASGYYTDQSTGQAYYYDAVHGQWYYVAAGLLYPLSITWQPSPSAKIDLIGGVDILRFNLTFKYKGPAVTQEFYAAVGNNSMSGAFGEWDGWQARKNVSIPRHDTFTTITGVYLDLPIKTAHSGDDLAAYCKKDQLIVVEGVDTTPYYYNVGHVVEAEGEFSSFSITKFEKV